MTDLSIYSKIGWLLMVFMTEKVNQDAHRMINAQELKHWIIKSAINGVVRIDPFTQ